MGESDRNRGRRKTRGVVPHTEETTWWPRLASDFVFWIANGTGSRTNELSKRTGSAFDIDPANSEADSRSQPERNTPELFAGLRRFVVRVAETTSAFVSDSISGEIAVLHRADRSRHTPRKYDFLSAMEPSRRPRAWLKARSGRCASPLSPAGYGVDRL